MLVLNEAAIKKSVRRRRTWYRRRLRFQRILVAAVVGVLIAGACWRNAAHFFGLPTIHSSQILPAAFWVRTSLRPDRPFPAIQSGKFAKAVHRIPGVYPYSVVPGGVKTPDDLRYASLRDPVVRRHFSHFDFQHAQLIRVAETREVFLSYRIRDTVFWTRKTVRLHRGELLLTDGKITARARCGNQISDTAKPEVSDEEPDADVVDQPAIAALSGPQFPVHPMLATPELPGGQPDPPAIFAGGFSFPYAPMGMPLSSRTCSKEDMIVNGKCVPKHKKPIAPEPPTNVLLISGLAIIGWRYRKTLRSNLA